MNLLVLAVPLLAIWALLCRRRRAAVWVLAVLAFVDLVAVAGPRHPRVRNAAVRPSRERFARGRLQGVGYVARLGQKQIPPPRLIIAQGFGHGTYNHTFQHRVHGVSGYNASSLMRFLDVIHLVNRGRFYPKTGLYKDEVALKPLRYESAVVDMLAAPYILTPRRLHQARFDLIKTIEKRGYKEYVYRNKRAVPRVYLAFHTTVATTDAQQQAALAGFDPHRTTIVDDPGWRLDGPQRIGPVRVVSQRPDRWVLEADVPRRAVLVIADSYYPGWQARVDDGDASIKPVNHLFRGIQLAAGHHRVELRFAPQSYRIGKWITLLTLGLLAAVWSRRVWRRAVSGVRRRRPGDRPVASTQGQMGGAACPLSR